MKNKTGTASRWSYARNRSKEAGEIHWLVKGIASLAGIVVTIIILWRCVSHQDAEIEAVTTAVPAIVAGIFIWCVCKPARVFYFWLRTPYFQALEQISRLERQNSECETRCRKFQTELQSLSDKIPILEIEACHAGKNDSPFEKDFAKNQGVDARYECYFRVTSKKSTAENVKVSLLGIEPNPNELGNGFQLVLNPSDPGGEKINPDGHSDFKIFTVFPGEPPKLEFANGQSFVPEFENPEAKVLQAGEIFTERLDKMLQELRCKKYRLRVGFSALNCRQKVEVFELNFPLFMHPAVELIKLSK